MPNLRTIAKIVARDKKCFYCPTIFIKNDGTTCNLNIATVDHLWPESQFGSDSVSNLVAACHSCNSKRGNHTPKNYSLKGKNKAEQIGELLDATACPSWLSGNAKSGFVIIATELPNYLIELHKEGSERIKSTLNKKDALVLRYSKDNTLQKSISVPAIAAHFGKEP